MVKALHPMTYQFLTVQMVESISEGGIINPSIHLRHGFDLLIFSNYVLTLIKNYINFIWPRLNPYCDYRLICPNGKQTLKLSNTFGTVVFLAIGKYINLTQYKQIVKKVSTQKLILTNRHVTVKMKNISRMLQKFIMKNLYWKILMNRGNNTASWNDKLDLEVL